MRQSLNAMWNSVTKVFLTVEKATDVIYKCVEVADINVQLVLDEETAKGAIRRKELEAEYKELLEAPQ